MLRKFLPPSLSARGGAIATLLALSTASTVPLGSLSPASAAEPCRFYTQWINGRNMRLNNCPPISGVFQNQRWQVRFGLAGDGEFLYIGTDRSTGSSIQIISSEMRGTTDRPIYVFRNGDTSYTVTYRADDHNAIRLEVFNNRGRLINQLLTRSGY